MKSITSAQFEQDPSSTLHRVEAGESYLVTRDSKPVARPLPLEDNLGIIPPRNLNGPRLSDIPWWPRKTLAEIETLLAEMEADR